MLSHYHKCLFIHIPKNAGQSVEHLFLDSLYLTWETRAPLLLRYNDKPELGPPRLAHLKAEEYVIFRYMTIEQFDSYFKFAFVRNPWDRVVSFYKYLGFINWIDFKTFVKKELKENLWNNKNFFVCPQSEYVCDKDGNIIVDFIGRFENLRNDFEYVANFLDLKTKILPHVNKSLSKNKQKKLNNIVKRAKNILSANHSIKMVNKKILLRLKAKLRVRPLPIFNNYIDYYDTETIELVRGMYHKDIELFGYTFGQKEPICELGLTKQFKSKMENSNIITQLTGCDSSSFNSL